MTFRYATQADTESIIELLRLSLGDGSTEKSSEFWRWKHVDNPFGPSPVLLALDKGRLAGIRAFMRWEWADGSTRYRALRAVDTATHPDYRGQGIFKKLTLRLVEDCKREGYDFIFNTPNEQSRPGYLKMGWEQIGKVPLRVAPYSPLGIVGQLIGGKSENSTRLDRAELDFGMVPDWLDGELPPAGKWTTPVSAEFLRWRYADCPVRAYAVSSAPDSYYLVYYLRTQRVGVELRLVHAVVRPGSEGAARLALAVILRKIRPSVVTAAPAKWLPWYFAPALPLGLILTFRPLNLAGPKPLADWNYTLGDLELF